MKSEFNLGFKWGNPLNSNIRCIEMAVLKDLCWYVKGWIVTLDVLKSIVKEGSANVNNVE